MSSPDSSHMTDHTGANAEVYPEVCAGTSGKSEVTDVSERYPRRKDLENALLGAALTWPEARHRTQAVLERGLQRDTDFEKSWPEVLGNLVETEKKGMSR